MCLSVVVLDRCPHMDSKFEPSNMKSENLFCINDIFRNEVRCIIPKIGNSNTKQQMDVKEYLSKQLNIIHLYKLSLAAFKHIFSPCLILSKLTQT